MFDRERLRARFVELCEIASPTGEERAVADHVAAELRALGLEVIEDEAAGPARAGAGNLLARLPGRPATTPGAEHWLMFAAHLDTVPHSGPIRVEREGDLFRSSTDTILGADNKAAVAVLMELVAGWAGAGPGGADLLAAAGPPVGIELVLTVAEEDGLRGAQHLGLENLRAPFGYVLDHASPIGELLVAGPTHFRIEIEFKGVEAHAGIRPEDGHSAIAAAARAIDRFELGRLDAETTANVGLISGGSAPNIVPGHCAIVGEVRSLDAARATALVTAMSEISADVATELDCDVAFSSEEIFRGYRLPPSSASVKVAEAALRRTGIEPTAKATGGGSDANALIARGFECLLLANGTKHNHTPEESVEGAELDRMLAVCDALLSEAAAHMEATADA